MDVMKRSRTLSLNEAENRNNDKKIKKEDLNVSCMFNDDEDDIWNFDDLNNKENLSQNEEAQECNKQANIDLKDWKRCFVKDVRRDTSNFDLILNLCLEKENSRGLCRLQGVWCHIRVEENQIVSLKAIWSDKFNCYVINNENGMIVTNPDTLISGTTVVGAVFCKRKCILQEKFRGIDSDSKIMMIGSLIHELLQIVLQQKLRTYSQINQASQELLASENWMATLYCSKMSIKEADDELQIFIPKIFEFVQKYIVGNKSNANQDEFEGYITDIEDIEQNLWIPQLGLKGKIDVSVQVKSKYKHIPTKKFMPLELKTGRASFSSEHKGQITLYNMMLQEIGESVDSGLLLYLRDGLMKEITASRNEKRDLIMLRNDIAYYLAYNAGNSFKNGQKDDLTNIPMKLETLKLPEPISHHSACNKCPYNTICSTLLTRDTEEKIPENHPLNKLSKDITNHLKPEHFTYFIHWCSILSLEEYEDQRANQTKMLWTDTPENRRNVGRAIDNLKLSGKVISNGQRFIHTFASNRSDKIFDSALLGINIGDYILVSCLGRINIAAGRVSDITTNSIIVSLERDLSVKYASEIYTIDKHFSSSGHIFNFTNLGVLLDDTDISKRLREIVIEKIKPTFSKVLPKIIAKEGLDILVEINAIQRKAVLKALTTNEYMLIKGLPGTGKTQTLVAIIRLFDMMKKSIIITSHTHSAVDNVLIRLQKHGVKFLRLGSDARINPILHDSGETKATANCKTPDDLARVYSSYNIVGVTCLGSAHSIFLHRKFDICIVDEATQVFQPTVLRPILFAKKFILVGDPDQLPPVVRSKNARDLGADESLFQRLDCTEGTSVLTVQYRMNRSITKLANDLIYQGSLQCANDDIKLASLQYLETKLLMEHYKNEKWIQRTLEKHVDFSTIFLDTDDCLERSNKFAESICNDLTEIIEQNFSENDATTARKDIKFKYTNYCEAAIAFSLTKALVISGCSAANIGIIAPYRAQVELLKKLLEKFQNYYEKVNDKTKFIGLEINTVDQFQGRDKDIIIYSCTKTGNYNSENHKNSILEDRRRITVAITRSKHKLIIIGDQKCLIQFTPFKDLYEKIPSRCKLAVRNGELGFSWQSILNILEVVMNSQ